MIMHDYEAQKRGARFIFPGVKQACDEFFKGNYAYRDGWSAVWEIKKARKKSGG